MAVLGPLSEELYRAVAHALEKSGYKLKRKKVHLGVAPGSTLLTACHAAPVLFVCVCLFVLPFFFPKEIIHFNGFFFSFFFVYLTRYCNPFFLLSSRKWHVIGNKVCQVLGRMFLYYSIIPWRCLQIRPAFQPRRSACRQVLLVNDRRRPNDLPEPLRYSGHSPVLIAFRGCVRRSRPRVRKGIVSSEAQSGV